MTTLSPGPTWVVENEEPLYNVKTARESDCYDYEKRKEDNSPTKPFVFRSLSLRYAELLSIPHSSLTLFNFSRFESGMATGTTIGLNILFRFDKRCAFANLEFSNCLHFQAGTDEPPPIGQSQALPPNRRSIPRPPGPVFPSPEYLEVTSIESHSFAGN
jgi:hypothetical protein